MISLMAMCVALLVGLNIGETVAGFPTLGERSVASSAKVFRVNYAPNRSAFEGTAFAVRNSKDEVYLVTAGHVCDGVAQLGGAVFLSTNDPESKFTLFKNPSLSKDMDVCIIGQLPDDAEAFDVADAVYATDDIFVTGFPAGLPLATLQGSALSVSIETVPYPYSVEECPEPAKEVADPNAPARTLTTCVIDFKLMLTTVPVAPGNSGSPVLNKNSEVVGLVSMMQASIPQGWGIMVPLDEFKKVLK